MFIEPKSRELFLAEHAILFTNLATVVAVAAIAAAIFTQTLPLILVAVGMVSMAFYTDYRCSTALDQRKGEVKIVVEKSVERVEVFQEVIRDDEQSVLLEKRIDELENTLFVNQKGAMLKEIEVIEIKKAYIELENSYNELYRLYEAATVVTRGREQSRGPSKEQFEKKEIRRTASYENIKK